MSGYQIQTAYDYCESITKLHARSFYFAAKFLPKHKQRAVYPVYAFCRHVDDEIDELGDGDERAAVKAVERWKQRLNDVYTGNQTRIPNSESKIQNPKSKIELVFTAWRDLLENYKIPERIPLELIRGVLMDTHIKRYETFEDLYVYCYRVASTVGLMSSEILGYADPLALEYAEALGIGMQLTNILRDVREDARRGRIYLPLEDLKKFNISEAQVLTGVFDENFRRMMRFQIERARSFYAEGEKGIALLEKDSRFTVLLASRIYAKILAEIEKLDYDVFKQRAFTTRRQKILSIPKIWLEAKRLESV